jgi:hypothetical protein
MGEYLPPTFLVRLWIYTDHVVLVYLTGSAIVADARLA